MKLSAVIGFALVAGIPFLSVGLQGRKCRQRNTLSPPPAQYSVPQQAPPKAVPNPIVQTSQKPKHQQQQQQQQPVRQQQPVSQQQQAPAQVDLNAIALLPLQQAIQALKQIVDKVPLPKTGNFQADCLKIHNDFRTLIGMAGFTVDNELIKAAQAWANNLASRDAFEHSNGPTGENLFQITGSTDSSCAGAVKAWFDEFDLYNGEPINRTPALFHEYGHVF
jgi:uncharacterized protein YkwD